MAPNLSNLNKFDAEIGSAIEFLDWKISPKEYDGAVKLVTISSIVVSILLSIITYLVYGYMQNSQLIESITINPFTILLGAIILFGAISTGIIYYFMSYPLIEVRNEQRRSLVYLPQIVGYIVMSLKLVPNMERAIKFAAMQGEGKLAEDLKKLVWETNIGVNTTVSDGIDKLAYRWEKYSKEFKEAIMMIKSSMVEENDARRAELLDKVVENLLDSIKIKMEGYARTLSQPSLVLFYVGILLPLLLVIILPIGSVFAKLPFSGPVFLIVVYNIALPLFIYLYARYVISTVPTLYRPPTIPDNYAGLPKRGSFRIQRFEFSLKIFVAIVFAIGIIISGALQIQYGVTLEKVMVNDNLPQKYIQNPNSYFDFLARESLKSRGIDPSGEKLLKEIENQKLLYQMQPGHDITPLFLVYGFALTLALCIFIYFYLDSIYKKRVQDYYVRMEDEFKESLYILASKLGEGKPMEQAIKITKDFFVGTSISSDMLAKTIDNINLLGMPIEQAFFDSTFGSLKNNPSNLIKNNMKLIVDASNLGVNTAAKTIVSMIVQLKNTDQIKNLVNKVTLDITQMMNTMSTMIAPAVLGITSSMQKVVVLTLNSLATSGISNSASSLQDVSIGGSNINPSALLGTFNMDNISLASPGTFNIIIIIYVILVVMILSYFTSRLQSDNPLETKLLIAYTVPIAVIIFIISALLSGMLLG